MVKRKHVWLLRVSISVLANLMKLMPLLLRWLAFVFYSHGRLSGTWKFFQFDCKTALLHAPIRHPIFARFYPGFSGVVSSKVVRILIALYGLRQSALEFYTLFRSLSVDLGMVRCDVDHGVFIGRWISPPDPSIPMPSDGSPLTLYVPLHVDDGLAITNSKCLYAWFIRTLQQRLLIVDMGSCQKFLNILIIRDRPARRTWLSMLVSSSTNGIFPLVRLPLFLFRLSPRILHRLLMPFLILTTLTSHLNTSNWLVVFCILLLRPDRISRTMRCGLASLMQNLPVRIFYWLSMFSGICQVLGCLR